MKKTALNAANEAGKIILRYYSKNVNAISKKNTYDLVTKADIDSEKKIISTIKNKYPGHSILTEESGEEITNSEYCWVIDPLDGTNNFYHKFPMFCVSIALYKKGKPLIGVVFDPIKDELFCAEKNKGASLNNKKIKVSTVNKLNKSLLALGFYYERGLLMRKSLGQMKKFFYENVHGIRRTGSAALDLCYTACGRFDGYWELKLNPWDYAAGSLILMEAGGRITDVQGKKYNLMIGNVAASNGKIHKYMLEILTQ
ncbi:archaeal fructose-1,6-bisphosphatase [Candidatus Scalindua japonica]|uniref:Inositol-1-monophosphatase n=1 Tax=Candidatus Scalindua japonica TaxID=1284222 RepID=A0A286U1T4_9BACT|nr:inositol monophosphatase family protein [Candidatus Scalindua japonica]GAX62110.1 archaeal fructose-1,6-bisphosphatase [Candidatus Scalindua japonica]